MAPGRDQPVDFGAPGRVQFPAAAWTAEFRSQSATGAMASRPDVPKHWVLATTAPCSRAIPAISAISLVFPTPAPPRTSTSAGWPAGS